jgi:hypothetical protein
VLGHGGSQTATVLSRQTFHIAVSSRCLTRSAPRPDLCRLHFGALAADDVEVSGSFVAADDAVPSPELVAAWFVLGQLELEHVPWWAAYWLGAGRDGDALRELAGLNDRDVHEVRDLVPRALAEISVELPTATVATALVVFEDLARRCLAGQAGERWVAQVVDETVTRADYSSDVIDLPLGGLHGVDDEWVPLLRAVSATPR